MADLISAPLRLTGREAAAGSLREPRGKASSAARLHSQ